MPKTRRIHHNIIEPFVELPIDQFVNQVPSELRPAMQDFAAAIQKRFRDLGTHHAASAGLRGSVGIAKQGTDSVGNSLPALVVQDQIRIESATNPAAGDPATEDDDQAVLTLGGLKRYLTCPRLWAILDICRDQADQTQQPTVVTSGLVHEFWNHTFHMPNSMNTMIGDPGNLESNQAQFNAMIIPVTAVVDQISFGTTDSVFFPARGAMSVGIYDMNQSGSSWPLIVQTSPFSFSGLVNNGACFTLPLAFRVTLPPGLYGIAWCSNCFVMECMEFNWPAASITNLQESASRPNIGGFPNVMSHYGTITGIDSGTALLPGTVTAANYNGRPIQQTGNICVTADCNRGMTTTGGVAKIPIWPGTGGIPIIYFSDSTFG